MYPWRPAGLVVWWPRDGWAIPWSHIEAGACDHQALGEMDHAKAIAFAGGYQTLKTLVKEGLQDVIKRKSTVTEEDVQRIFGKLKRPKEE